jgi:hypothetical protein
LKASWLKKLRGGCAVREAAAFLVGGKMSVPRWASHQIGLQVVAIRWWVSPESPDLMVARKSRCSVWNVSGENTSQLHSHSTSPDILEETGPSAPGGAWAGGRPRRRVPEIRAGPCAEDQSHVAGDDST